ncbi:MAG TPA: hypothetical protein DDX25_01135 [Firmicutes bacterium]|nr:hypothetical protein [Bacillota bacterium]
MVLRVKPTGITVAGKGAKPGPLGDGSYYVKISGVPKGVSAAQVIILFAHTARRQAEREGRYEFPFAELT